MENTQKKTMGLKAARRISNTLIYIVLVGMSIIWLVPFFLIVIQSLRVESTKMEPYILPRQWGFDNYVSRP